MRKACFALCLMLCVQVGAVPSVWSKEEVKKIQVVVTNSLLADWVKAVGKDRVEVHALVGPNGDMHTFEPTPQDSILLSKAQTVIGLGLDLEPWLADLYQSSGSRGHRYTVAEGLDLIHLVKQEGMFHDEVDPHFWHDPTKVMTVVEKIANAFVNEDTANAQVYWENASAYIKELGKLDEWVAKQVRKIPQERRKIVTSHDTFAYFAKRYGFQVIGSVIGSTTTESADPSAQAMAELTKEIKESGAPAVFLENVNNSKAAQSLAKESGIKLAPPLYTDALGGEGSPAPTYIDMMKHNVQVITDALKK